MMTLDEYQQAALSTAVYPGQGTTAGAVYCALGVNGESGEFTEKLLEILCVASAMQVAASKIAEQSKKALRDDASVVTAQRRDAMLKELGGVLWYTAALAHELGATLSEVAGGNVAQLADRKARGVLGGSGDNR